MYNSRFPHPGMPASGMRYQGTMMPGMRYPPVYPNDPRYDLVVLSLMTTCIGILVIDVIIVNC